MRAACDFLRMKRLVILVAAVGALAVVSAPRRAESSAGPHSFARARRRAEDDVGQRLLRFAGDARRHAVQEHLRHVPRRHARRHGLRGRAVGQVVPRQLGRAHARPALRQDLYVDAAGQSEVGPARAARGHSRVRARAEPFPGGKAGTQRKHGAAERDHAVEEPPVTAGHP